MSSFIVFVLIGGFAAISGINDGGNMVGTFMNTRAVSPWILLPVLIASIAFGPVFFGTAVSHTIAVEILNVGRTGSLVLAVSLASSVMTLGVSWWLRVPSSTTVALAGGMIGAAVVDGGAAAIHWMGVAKVGVGLVGSVAMGFLVAFGLTRILWRIFQTMSQKTAKRLGYLQVVTVMIQGLAYGANDQEKAIGLMALYFMLQQSPARYHVDSWDIVVPLVFWVIGLMAGGWRIARTVSGHIFRLRPLHALTTQAAAAMTVIAAALAGLPVSTTQTTDGGLFGLGTALAPRRVQWITVRRVVGVWLTTMPLALVIGMTLMEAVRLAGG